MAGHMTLGELLDGSIELHVFCGRAPDCWHGAKADVATLVSRYGRDHGAMHDDLVRLPWRCARCGGRKVSFRFIPVIPGQTTR